MTPSIFPQCQRFSTQSIRSQQAGQRTNTPIQTAARHYSQNEWITPSGRCEHVSTDGFLETHGHKWLKYPMRWWVTQIHLRQQKKTIKNLSNQCTTNTLDNDIKELPNKATKSKHFTSKSFSLLATWTVWADSLNFSELRVANGIWDDKRVGVNNAGPECEWAKHRSTLINFILCRRVSAAAACQNIFIQYLKVVILLMPRLATRQAPDASFLCIG